MMALISWLVNIAKAIGYWNIELFKEGIKAMASVWGFVLIIGGLMYYAMNDTVGAINDVAALFGSMSVPSDPTSHGGSLNVTFLLQVCNTFTPLDEIFSYAASYFVLVGAFGVYRAVKSWLPGGFAGGS